jgi:hypothetical protein
MAALAEQLRRAEEENGIVAEAIVELEKELALHGELHGSTRARVRVVVWAAVALFMLGVGSFAGIVAFERREERHVSASESAIVRERKNAQVTVATCEGTVATLKYNVVMCNDGWGTESHP